MREAVISLLSLLQYKVVEGRETAVGATHREWIYPHQNGASLFGYLFYGVKGGVGGRSMQRRFYITMLTMAKNQITAEPLPTSG